MSGTQSQSFATRQPDSSPYCVPRKQSPVLPATHFCIWFCCVSGCFVCICSMIVYLVVLYVSTAGVFCLYACDLSCLSSLSLSLTAGKKQNKISTFFKTFMANILPAAAPTTFRTWKTCREGKTNMFETGSTQQMKKTSHVFSTFLLLLGHHKYLSITAFPQDPQ